MRHEGRISELSSQLRRRVRVMRLYTHDLQSIPDVPLQPGDRVEALDPSRYRILREIHPIDIAEDQSRLEAGHKCFVGWSNERPAHFTWAQDAGVHEIRGTWRRDPIEPGDFWLYSARTAEWARGRRLLPAALAMILRDYKQRNYQRALATIAEENVSSFRAAERAGFVLTGRIRSFAVRSSLIPLPGSTYLAKGA